MGVSDYLKKSTTFTAHSSTASNFYAGSKLLQPLADSSGMGIDQVNFLICLALSMVLAVVFRLTMHKMSVTMRHLIEMIVGIALAYFCFGNQIIYVFLQATGTYLIMRFAPPQHGHIVAFVFCFAYLSATHIIRQIYDYGGYTLDVTLPLMMLTQRLTSLAFSVHDGLTSIIDNLPHDQKFFAVQRFPSLLEFYSYTFYFHGILCGPFVHYADYLSFIEGRSFTRFLTPSAGSIAKEETGVIGNSARPKTEIATVRVQVLHPPKDHVPIAQPLTTEELFKSSMINGLKSLGLAVFCGALQLTLQPMFPISKLTDAEFHATMPFWYRQAYIMGFIFATKQRYYFAWKFSDAINIFSGLSYSGVSEKGKGLWRLTDNIDIREFEFGTRFAVHINAWNKTTSNWLRFMIYDRATWHPTLLTFTISALWHGFYPGYYIAFLTATLFLQAVRVVRSTLRPLCELSTVPRMFYDLVAFILVRFASAYMALPFLLMTFASCYENYKSLYFWPQVLALVAIIAVPRLRRFLPESMRQKKVYGRARSHKHTGKGQSDQGTSDDGSRARMNLSSDEVDSGGAESDSGAKPIKAE